MTANSHYSSGRLASRAAIQDHLYRWCRAVDRCDWDTVRNEIFHSDGYDNHGMYKGDVAGLTKWLSERHKGISRSMHFVSNLLIEFIDDDNALVESYSMAYQRYSPEGAAALKAISGGADLGTDSTFDLMVVGRYIDHFQCREGDWRILRRTTVFDNSTMIPVPPGGAKLADDWPVSKRDRSDPLWDLLKTHGLAQP